MATIKFGRSEKARNIFAVSSLGNPTAQVLVARNAFVDLLCDGAYPKSLLNFM